MIGVAAAVGRRVGALDRDNGRSARVQVADVDGAAILDAPGLCPEMPAETSASACIDQEERAEVRRHGQAGIRGVREVLLDGPADLLVAAVRADDPELAVVCVGHAAMSD